MQKYSDLNGDSSECSWRNAVFKVPEVPGEGSMMLKGHKTNSGLVRIIAINGGALSCDLKQVG